MTSARRRDLNYYLSLGVLLSLLIHITFVWSLARAKPVPQPTPLFATIETNEAPPDDRKQLVSESKSEPNLEPPKDARFESEHDTAVKREQVRRGDNNASMAPAKISRPEKAQRESKQPREATTREDQTPKKLNLDPATILEKFGTTPEIKRERLDLSRPSDITAYEPFSRPFGTGAAFLGQSGTNDFLPDLPDGDITLLNAKANRFAVFVRRVATRVFSNMRTSGWEVLRHLDINSANEFAVVKVVMSAKGEVLDVTLDSSSGSARFDRVLFEASKSGARDPNPPPGALAYDGNIHFVFESRSWSEVFSEGRGGRMVERRWLLLGTGLE